MPTPGDRPRRRGLEPFFVRYRADLTRGGIAALFTSGYTNAPHEIFDEPGAAFIGKPFSAHALVAKVREVLDG